MMKRILVPTDFSFCANKALDYAVCLAKKSGAEIILLHACELIHSPFQDRKELIAEYNQSVQENANKQLQLLEKSIEETEQVPVETDLYDGNVIDSILHAAEIKGSDLIVMGTVGRTGLRHKILGSRTAELISESKLPVITIPFEFEWTEPKRILLALNNPDEHLESLKPAFDIASLFGADVQTAIFTDVNNEAVAVMEHSRSNYSIQQKLQKTYVNTEVKTVHLSGRDFQKTLQDYIITHDINLLAMITHKRKAMQRVFDRSLTCKMGYHTHVPLLSMQA